MHATALLWFCNQVIATPVSISTNTQILSRNIRFPHLITMIPPRQCCPVGDTLLSCPFSLSYAPPLSCHGCHLCHLSILKPPTGHWTVENLSDSARLVRDGARQLASLTNRTHARKVSLGVRQTSLDWGRELVTGTW